MRVLVVEDDGRTAGYLVRGLTESGHVVDLAADGETALAMALEGIYEALVAGCDDYLAKPFSFVELLARLEALARRTDRSRHAPILRVGDLEVDTVRRRVSRGGRPVRLQRREFLLLERLVRHAGQVVTRSMLLEAAWEYEFEARGNIVDMHIHRLRQKVDEGFAYSLIRTLPGAGYMLRPPDDTSETPDPAA